MSIIQYQVEWIENKFIINRLNKIDCLYIWFDVKYIYDIPNMV